MLLFSKCVYDKIDSLNLKKLLDYVNAWKIPKFPISGEYLKKHGYEAGEELGKKLKFLEEKWIENNFIMEEQVVEKSLSKACKN